MEIWKPVVGYEGFYEVSNYGRVRSVDHFANTGIKHSDRRYVKGHILKPHTKRRGYLSVDLSMGNNVKTILVHKLVATAFLEKRDCDNQVNHKNCITSDNRVENLEWCTGEENRAHAKLNNRYYNPNKVPVRCKQTNMVFQSSYDAAQWVNTTKFQNSGQVKNIACKIRCARMGIQKTAYGYTWETA